MNFMRRLGTFWIILLGMALAGYFLIFNLEWIYVTLPHIGEVKVRAAVAYIVTFFCGASLVILFFGADSLKKSMLLRKKNKQIRDLEKALAHFERPSQQMITSTEPEVGAQIE